MRLIPLHVKQHPRVSQAEKNQYFREGARLMGSDAQSVKFQSSVSAVIQNTRIHPTSAAYFTPSMTCSEPWSSEEPQCRCSWRRRYAPVSGPPLSTAGTRHPSASWSGRGTVIGCDHSLWALQGTGSAPARSSPPTAPLQGAHNPRQFMWLVLNPLVRSSCLVWKLWKLLWVKHRIKWQLPNKPLFSWQVDTLRILVWREKGGVHKWLLSRKGLLTKDWSDNCKQSVSVTMVADK